MNNLNVSAEYMQRLVDEARGQVETTAIWKNKEQDVPAACAALDELLKASTKFRGTLQVIVYLKRNKLAFLSLTNQIDNRAGWSS